MFSNILLLDAAAANCCNGWWGCPWWLWWSLGMFLLGALLYWLFVCRDKQKEIDTLREDRDSYHAQLSNLQKDFASVDYQLDEAKKEIMSLKAALSSCEGDKSILLADLEAAKSAGAATTGLGIMGAAAASDRGVDYAALLGTDNHQIVEGVGPKIDGLLKAAGIANWADLANSSVERIQGVLDDAGSRYRLADPKTWPRQAALANEGKWDELIEYQKFLDTGVETKGDFETPSKVQKMIVKLLGYSTNPEDLKVVEGIGPKIEGLLKDAGIKNWSDLAVATTDRLKEVLAAAGDRYKLANPSTWAKQAGLAAEAKWDELRAYQDYLDGGKDPAAK